MRQGGPGPIVSAMPTRITFLTIGQTPRSDLVPDLVASLPRDVDVAEIGALDGLDDDTIAGLEPGEDDRALVTRLRNGRQAVVGKRWVTARLRALLADAPDATATVLLCTGDFPELVPDRKVDRDPGGGVGSGPTQPASDPVDPRSSESADPGHLGLFLDAQHLVDHGVEALCHGARTLGLLVPLARQEGEHHLEPREGRSLKTAHASPYDDQADFEAAGRALADCDVIVMHCMGYTDAQRTAVAAGSGRPVLLARRLVAAGIGQLF